MPAAGAARPVGILIMRSNIRERTNLVLTVRYYQPVTLLHRSTEYTEKLVISTTLNANDNLSWLYLIQSSQLKTQSSINI